MDTTVLEEVPVVVNIVILVVFSNMRYSFEKEEAIPLTKADPHCVKILGLCLIRDYVHRRPFFQDRRGALKKVPPQLFLDFRVLQYSHMPNNRYAL